MKVDLIDVMGDDLRVVNAARVSFAKESDWIIDKNKSIYESGVLTDPYITISEQDQKLIKYLANHNHWTPFSHVQITMREKVPIFISRQRFKHMVGFTYNEVSRRYVDDDPEFYTPSVWRGRPVNAKQGSSDEIIGIGNETPFHVNIEQDWMIDSDVYYDEYIALCTGMYKALIAEGVAPEQARMVLPQSMYTEYYATGSLAAWARVYKLRSHSDAQMEIQELAKMWDNEIRKLDQLKYSWSALVDPR